VLPAMSQRHRHSDGPPSLCGVRPHSARIEGDRDANYRVRFTRGVKLDFGVAQLISRSPELESHRFFCSLTGLAGSCRAQRSMLCTEAAGSQEKGV
jgi:hypothetical protein